MLDFGARSRMEYAVPKILNLPFNSKKESYG
jgi:hypothetical protein